MCVCCQTRVVGEIAAIFPAMAKSILSLSIRAHLAFQIFAENHHCHLNLNLF